MIACRYPFFFGAIQMVEANPSLTDRVVTSMYKFVSLANSMLQNGEGLEDWTKTRWEDFVITLQWYVTARLRTRDTQRVAGCTTSTRMGKKIC